MRNKSFALTDLTVCDFDSNSNLKVHLKLSIASALFTIDKWFPFALILQLDTMQSNAMQYNGMYCLNGIRWILSALYLDWKPFRLDCFNVTTFFFVFTFYFFCGRCIWTCICFCFRAIQYCVMIDTKHVRDSEWCIQGSFPTIFWNSHNVMFCHH